MEWVSYLKGAFTCSNLQHVDIDDHVLSDALQVGWHSEVNVSVVATSTWPTNLQSTVELCNMSRSHDRNKLHWPSIFDQD